MPRFVLSTCLGMSAKGMFNGTDSSYLGPGGIPQENDYFSRMERKVMTGEGGTLGPSPWDKPISSIAGKTPVIGKMQDLKNVGANEYRVADMLPNQGSPKANWKQNAGVLRTIMHFGRPIRDASPYPMPNAGFLGAERNLLENHGWSYNQGYWYPPIGGSR